MEAANAPWRPIGELFVARGLITQDQLEEALAEQAATGKRLGEILVDRHLISSPELTEVLMEQLGREVAKEEGFGSGLWSEIDRRNARGDGEPMLSLVETDEVRSFGASLTDSLAVRASEGRGVELPAVAFEQLWSDVAGGASETELGSSSSGAAQSEPGTSSLELAAYEDTIASLTSELQEARAAVAAREELLEQETEARQGFRRDVQVLRERLAEREAQVMEINATIASLTAAREEQEAARPQADEQLQAELAAMRRELDMRVARVAQLECEVEAHAGRVGELERLLEEAQRDPGDPAELRIAKSRIAQLDGENATFRAQLAVADAALDEERAAHARTGELAEQLAGDRARSEDALADSQRALEAARREREFSVADLDQDRHVAAELDEIQAELEVLNATRDELEERLAAAEAGGHLDAEIAALGERVEAAESELRQERESHAATLGRLDEAIADLAARGAATGDREQPSFGEFLYFAPGEQGYRLMPDFGAIPGVGHRRELNGAEYVVIRVGRSPLPSDPRRCAYLQAN